MIHLRLTNNDGKQGLACGAPLDADTRWAVGVHFDDQTAAERCPDCTLLRVCGLVAAIGEEQRGQLKGAHLKKHVAELTTGISERWNAQRIEIMARYHEGIAEINKRHAEALQAIEARRAVERKRERFGMAVGLILLGLSVLATAAAAFLRITTAP